jgi:hypothetical protein
MNKNHFVVWLTVAGVIGILFGVFYAIFGLDGLPVYQKFVTQANFEGWSRGLYGSVFIGFSVLLLFVGRRAVQQNDKVLAKILLYGVLAWLVVEAFVSLVYGVYINVAVDVALAAFLGYPLLKVIRN